MTKEKANNKSAPAPKKTDDALVMDSPMDVVTDIKSADDLKKFLISIRDRLSDKTCAPVYALSGLAHALKLTGIYQFLNEDNRELARDIWLRLKKSGLHVQAPPILFSEEELKQDGAR
jgi:hypothetical protein